jgi:hypothetical protein
MEGLIKQALLHVDIIGPHVHQGHYDLVGPDGEIVLSQVWSTMVQPGWSVTMHMWPMPEPREEPSAPLPTAPPLIEKGSSSKHNKPTMLPDSMVDLPPPPPLPPMGAGGAPPPSPPAGSGLPPGVMVIPAPSTSGSSHKPKKKPAAGGFYAWAAGGNGRSGSVKKSSKKA